MQLGNKNLGFFLVSVKKSKYVYRDIKIILYRSLIKSVVNYGRENTLKKKIPRRIQVYGEKSPKTMKTIDGCELQPSKTNKIQH